MIERTEAIIALRKEEMKRILKYKGFVIALLDGYEEEETDGIIDQLIAVGRGIA